MRNRLLAAGAALAVAAIGLVACSPSTSPGTPTQTATDDPVAALYQAAKAEGTLVWYSSREEQNAITEFEKLYPGIDVQYLRLPAGDLATRFSQEHDAGTVNADVLTIANEQFVVDGQAKGWFDESPDLPALADWPKDYYANGAARVSISPIGIAYNTDLVPADKVPSTWQQAIDASLGPVGMGDPRTVPSYLAQATIWQSEYGDGFLTAIANRKPTIAASTQTINQQIAAGGIAISLTDAAGLVKVLTDKGAPLAFKSICPCTGSEFYAVLPVKAAHPNAAKLFMNFLLTKDGQVSFNADYASPLGAVGDAIAIPDGYEHVALDDVAKAKPSVLKALNLN